MGTECKPTPFRRSKRTMSATKTPGTFSIGPFSISTAKYTPGGVAVAGSPATPVAAAYVAMTCCPS
jgi:hypothetical protein